ncbi:MAG: hypothetical protein JNG89_05235 [Planctomycetaceae bacterium]|nr:hypothetical protein [Planctomycetaceae bacterium]
MPLRRLGYWFRRAVSRLALLLGIFCILELFMHLTEGTIPNLRVPLEYWPYFVAGLGLCSLTVAWLTYDPLESANSRNSDPPPE